MAELEADRHVAASADAVFAVAADARRLGEWVPTVSSADVARDGTVEVTGEVRGAPYSDSGFWRPRPEQLRVEWSQPSRGGEPSRYAGWLQVEHAEPGQSSVVAHLTFSDDSDGGGGGGGGPAGEEAQQSLRTALDRLAGLAEEG